MRVLAIDPGETCGLALLHIVDGGLRGLYVDAVKPGVVYDWLKRPKAHTKDIDVVVCEEFRLYPWLAQKQGFSSFPTVECIGVIKYICATKGYPLYMQRSDIKKEARDIAERTGWTMVERSLGSGRGKYRGPDFNYPGAQHPRDALAHGVWWAYRNPVSPLHSKDEHE